MSTCLTVTEAVPWLRRQLVRKETRKFPHLHFPLYLCQAAGHPPALSDSKSGSLTSQVDLYHLRKKCLEGGNNPCANGQLVGRSGGSEKMMLPSGGAVKAVLRKAKQRLAKLLQRNSKSKNSQGSFENTLGRDTVFAIFFLNREHYII